MLKSTLETFIKKYSLGGNCEAAHWYSDSVSKTLTARAHTDIKSVILKVVLKNWEGMESCVLALPSSTKIKSMLSPIGEEVTITLNKVRDRIVNFVVSDNDCEAICTVAVNDAFPETYDVDTDTSGKVPTEFDAEIKLTDAFIDRMMKGVAALPESKDFVLMNNKKGGLDMIINYDDVNTNRIKIPVETVNSSVLVRPLAFSTPVFKSIVSCNEPPRLPSPKTKSSPTSTSVDGAPDCPADDSVPHVPILKVSSSGIAIIEFDDNLFQSKYFLFLTREID